MSARTRAFQWFADHYPTPWMARSKLLRLPWRAALAVLSPRETITMRLPDYRMLLDPRRRHHGRGILLRGRIEPTTTAHFRGSVRPGMTVADIGANVGHYTLVAAGLVGDTGHVYAFEPEPSNFSWLERNIRLNGFANVTALRQAVSDRPGTATLHLHAFNAGGHSFDPRNVSEGGSLEVATVTLDDVLREKTLDVLKIDVQGAEGLVIEGAAEVLARSDTKIYLEYSPFVLRRCGTDPHGLLETLRGLGYRPRVVFRRPHVLTEGLDAMLEKDAGSDDPRVAFNVLFAR